MQYYLKARFQFDKDRFADLMVIFGAASTISQASHTILFQFFHVSFPV